MMIIDPPVTPFSPPAEIESWIKKLATYSQDEPAVQRAMADAKRGLEFAQSLEAESRQELRRRAA